MGNRIRLIDDVHLDHSLSEESLSTDFEGVDLNIDKKGKRNAVERKVIKEDKEEDLFDFSSALNKKK